MTTIAALARLLRGRRAGTSLQRGEATEIFYQDLAPVRAILNQIARAQTAQPSRHLLPACADQRCDLLALEIHHMSPIGGGQARQQMGQARVGRVQRELLDPVVGREEPLRGEAERVQGLREGWEVRNESTSAAGRRPTATDSAIASM